MRAGEVPWRGSSKRRTAFSCTPSAAAKATRVWPLSRNAIARAALAAMPGGTATSCSPGPAGVGPGMGSPSSMRPASASPGDSGIAVASRKRHYASEQRTLSAAVELLSFRRCEAVLLANFHVDDRQVDLVVATENRLVVIEAKSFARAVRGGKNGPWEIETAGGRRIEARNPSGQALTAKYAVRDATPTLWAGSNRYPSGAVVFVPGLPDGSEVPAGDFKVSMIDLDDLGEILVAAANCGGDLAEARRTADAFRCTRVWSVAEACHPVLAEHARLIKTYGRELVRTYGPRASPVAFGCLNADGRVVMSGDVRDWVADGRQDVLVLGGSGRGKTMLAQACTVELVRGGGVALLVAVRDYDGDLRSVSVLDTEAALLGAASAGVLLRSCRALSRQVLFVVDGYNECSATRREGLTRRVAALVRRHAARVLVTSQCGLARCAWRRRTCGARSTVWRRWRATTWARIPRTGRGSCTSTAEGRS